MARSSLAVVGPAIAVAVCALLAPSGGAVSHASTAATRFTVGSSAGLDRAAAALRASGGTIVLRPRLYQELVIHWRGSKLLRIVGMPGTRVERVVFDRASRVSFGNVVVGPIHGEAMVDLRDSRHIVLHDLVVTARGSRYRSFVRVPYSRDVTIRDSDFSHCGERSPKFADCVLLWRWSHNIVIANNRFHDPDRCTPSRRVRRLDSDELEVRKRPPGTFAQASGVHVLAFVPSQADAAAIGELPGVTERSAPVPLVFATLGRARDQAPP